MARVKAKVRQASTVRPKAAPHTNGKSPRPAPFAWPPWVWLSCLAVAVLAVFFPITSHPFVSWDDPRLIYLNPWLRHIDLQSFEHFWRYPFFDLFVPFLYTVYEGVTLISRLAHPGDGVFAPSVFHWASIVVHLGSVFAVFGILRRLDFPGYAAFLGALLFAVHPLQAEPVSWASGLDTLLAGFLCLAALWQYLIYAKAGEKGARRWAHFAAASVFYVLAILAKPSAVSLPVMAAVLELTLLRRPIRSFALPLAAWLVFAVSWAHFTTRVQHVDPGVIVAYWQRPFIAGDALAFYLAKLFAPYPLALDYGRTPAFVIGHTWGYATWLAPAALAVVAWRLYRKVPEAAASLGLMAAGLLPMLGLVPFLFQAFSTVADRYMYLAMLGPALAVATLAARLRPPALHVVFGVIAVFGVLCAAQTETWRSSEWLYQHSLAIYPGTANIYDKLGDLYVARGDYAGAISEYLIATRLDPSDGPGFTNAAFAMAREGDDADAVVCYQHALADDPTLVKAHFGLGLIYAEHHQLAPAADEWGRAVALSPGNADFRYNLGVVLFRLGRYAEAADQFQADLSIRPGDAGAERWLAATNAAEKAGGK